MVVFDLQKSCINQVSFVRTVHCDAYGIYGELRIADHALRSSAYKYACVIYAILTMQALDLHGDVHCNNCRQTHKELRSNL